MKLLGIPSTSDKNARLNGWDGHPKAQVLRKFRLTAFLQRSIHSSGSRCASTTLSWCCIFRKSSSFTLENRPREDRYLLWTLPVSSFARSSLKQLSKVLSVGRSRVFHQNHQCEKVFLRTHSLPFLLVQRNEAVKWNSEIFSHNLHVYALLGVNAIYFLILLTSITLGVSP